MKADLLATSHALKLIHFQSKKAAAKEQLLYLWLADRLNLMRHGIGITRNQYFNSAEYVPTPVEATHILASGMHLRCGVGLRALSENALQSICEVLAHYGQFTYEANRVQAARFPEAILHAPMQPISYSCFFTPAPPCLPLFDRVSEEAIRMSRLYFEMF